MARPIPAAHIRRIHYGYIVSPEGYPDAGLPLPVSGFLVPYPGGTLLFDTGLSPVDEETRARYHPRMQTMEAALASAGASLTDIDVIANCHFHADHAGGNHHFPNVRVVVQQAELEAARQPDYTFPQYAFDYPGAQLDVVDGETDLAPGLRLLPTPGHTPGHQSLLVDTDAGRWLLAGQASNTTWEFSAQAFSARIAAEGLDPVGTYPDWMAHLRAWGVKRAFFAHDLVVWERDESDLGHPERI
ncbi:MAG: N-acyl homoserine lactonase family protein [Candidatus Limnocylindria bacterium]